jgi:hypothetical protein
MGSECSPSANGTKATRSLSKIPGNKKRRGENNEFLKHKNYSSKQESGGVLCASVL